MQASGRGSGELGLRLVGVSAGYRRRSVLKSVDLTFGNGVHGILGPNGSGKTTLFRVLAGLVRAEAGSVVLDSEAFDPRGSAVARAKIGYLPQRFDTVGSMTVAAHVQYAAWANGVDGSNCEAVGARALALVDLASLSGARVRTLSGGQRQRLGIACAIAHQPRLLLLDEPTVGLDPLQRVQVREHLAEVGRSTIVVVSTHVVEDLTQVADDVVVMIEGRVAFDGSVADMSALGEDLPHMSRLEAAYRTVASTEVR